MDDASLDMRIGKDRPDGVGEAGKAVHAGDQYVPDAPVPELVQHVRPEPCAFVFGYPEAQDLLSAIHIDAQSHECGLACRFPVLPRIGAQGIEIEDRIRFAEGPLLPFPHLLHDAARHLRDELSRHVRAAYLLEVRPYVPLAHAEGVHGNDLVVEEGEALLPFGDYCGFERRLPVPRNPYAGNVVVARDRPFAGEAVPAVSAVVVFGRALTVSEVMVHFGLKGPVDDFGRERLYEPVLAEHPLLRHAARIETVYDPVQLILFLCFLKLKLLFIF